MVDAPPFASKRFAHPAVAVAGELQDDPLDGIPQSDILSGLPLGCPGLLVVPRAAYPKQLAQSRERDLGVLQGGLFDHEAPPCKWCLESPFFRISFSRASLPQNLSSSAILASSASLSESCLSVKAASPRASYSLRHLKSTLSERLCSRQICAGRFWPVATCRQH